MVGVAHDILFLQQLLSELDDVAVIFMDIERLQFVLLLQRLIPSLTINDDGFVYIQCTASDHT